MENVLRADDLISQSWQMYARFEAQPFLVKPSIPILYFGDRKKYFASELRVITVGLNPSRLEFPENDRFSRFDRARGIYPGVLDGSLAEEYLEALDEYFHENPYSGWFNCFEPLLAGLDCSYYGSAANTALHTDLCSPLATSPTWSSLPRPAQSELLQSGTGLWHSLIRWLAPDVIIASVAKKHLQRIAFSQDRWETVYTVSRVNPYNVVLSWLKIPEVGTAALVFGKAAQKPFGTVSSEEKRKIGLALRIRLSAVGRQQRNPPRLRP